MAENTEEIPAASCSVPGEDPPVPTTADGGEKPKKDPDTAHQPKRRKNCPTSLDKFEAIKQCSANSSFSFTFDTNFSGTPEVTPKFGSFNSAVAVPEMDRCLQIPATSKRKAEEVAIEVAEEEEEEKSEVNEERREVVGILSSVDGVESTID